MKYNWKEYYSQWDIYAAIEEQNKLLKEENKSLKNELMEDMKTESKLNEEIRNLKSELSKFSEAYKKYRDYEKEELAESCYDLARENEKLKADTEHTVKFNNKIIGELKLENDKLKDKIDKLEFDIEAWKKLKAVREEKERMLNEKIGKLVMKQ